MIAIVDTGGANLASVTNALSRLGESAVVTSQADEIFKAGHVILPGVGAAKDSMDRLKKKELVACLRELKQPTLGICLGMQLLFESSEEGETDCLGILPGKVQRLPTQTGFPVPHMGWNQLEFTQTTSCLLKGIAPENHFYFVHSFAAPQGEWVAANFIYGSAFPAVVQRENYFGVQFHPEKSAVSGATLLRNFLTL